MFQRRCNATFSTCLDCYPIRSGLLITLSCLRMLICSLLPSVYLLWSVYFFFVINIVSRRRVEWGDIKYIARPQMNGISAATGVFCWVEIVMADLLLLHITVACSVLWPPKTNHRSSSYRATDNNNKNNWRGDWESLCRGLRGHVTIDAWVLTNRDSHGVLMCTTEWIL